MISVTFPESTNVLTRKAGSMSSTCTFLSQPVASGRKSSSARSTGAGIRVESVCSAYIYFLRMVFPHYRCSGFPRNIGHLFSFPPPCPSKQSEIIAPFHRALQFGVRVHSSPHGGAQDTLDHPTFQPPAQGTLLPVSTVRRHGVARKQV